MQIIETNPQADGVDIVTRTTITRAEVLARTQYLNDQIRALSDEAQRIAALAVKLPAEEQGASNE